VWGASSIQPPPHGNGLSRGARTYIKYEEKVGKSKKEKVDKSFLQGLSILVGFQDILRGFGRILEDLGDNFEEYLNNP
jgi:hypothetical protein